MPSAERRINADIERFLVPLRRAGRSQRTLDAYKYLLRRDLIYLHEHGYSTTVSGIGSSEIEFLILTRWTGAPKYNHNRRSVFRQYLEYHGNRVFDEYPEPYGALMRINVDWLSDREAVRMYSVPMSPIEKLIIHLELRLALRRFDILNLTLGDVNNGHLVVHGKGNKIRTVPFVNDTLTALSDWKTCRKGITDDTSPDGPLLMIPRYGAHRPGKTFVDNLVKDVCARSGIVRPVSNHTLRRTCARMWYRAGVPLATISSLLGHADVKTTVKYLGLTMDDLNNGASMYDRYFSEILSENSGCPKIGQNEGIASKSGGLGEI